MKLGIGSGSTIVYSIQRLGKIIINLGGLAPRVVRIMFVVRVAMFYCVQPRG